MIHSSSGQLQRLYSLRGDVAQIEAGKQQAMTVGWELFWGPFKEAIIGSNFKAYWTTIQKKKNTTIMLALQNKNMNVYL